MWKFKPILKETIWGGDLILSYKRLASDLGRVGESWEISNVEGSESVVDGGSDNGVRLSELIDRHGASLLGHRNYDRFGNRFPLLVKFIDAHDDLSVQVHPDDEVATRHGMDNGKTEMWYVIKAREGARIVNGFKRHVEPSEYDDLVRTGEIEEVLRYVPVREGDVFYIPAGRVHAICSGVLIAEVQQTSDATYRIYDYNRTDSEGRSRDLHTELAREAINFHDTDGSPLPYTQITNVPSTVINAPYFSTNVLNADAGLVRDYSENDMFVILMITAGEASVSCGSETIDCKAGDTILVPASATGVRINPENTVNLLEIFIR